MSPYFWPWFPKIHSLSTGEAHSRVEASITSPTSPPYVAKQLMALFHTTAPQRSSLLHCNNNTVSRILVKAQPSTRSIGPRSTTRLGIRSQVLGLPIEYSLCHCAFLLLLHTSLLSQAGITHYSQQRTLQHSTKLLLVFFFGCLFFLSQSKLIFKIPTTTLRVPPGHILIILIIN